MHPTPVLNISSIPERRQGSALLVVLLVSALLLMLALAFSVVVRLELRSLDQQMQLALSQANAKLGLQLGIAQLQELTGPDTRSTARGKLLEGVTPTASKLKVTGAALNWIGVWDSAERNETDAGAQTRDGFLGWLASGTKTWGVDEAYSPSPDRDERLFGPGTLAPASEYTYAPRVDFHAGNTTPGAYAWAVEDESLKAQLLPFRENSDPATPSGGVIPGAYPPASLSGMSTLSGVDISDLRKTQSLSDFAFLGADPALADPVRMSRAVGPVRLEDGQTQPSRAGLWLSRAVGPPGAAVPNNNGSTGNIGGFAGGTGHPNPKFKLMFTRVF